MHRYLSGNVRRASKHIGAVQSTRDNIPMIDAPTSKQAKITPQEETPVETYVRRPTKRRRTQGKQPETSVDLA